MSNDVAIMENSMEIPQTLKIELSHDTVIPLQGVGQNDWNQDLRELSTLSCALQLCAQ